MEYDYIGAPWFFGDDLNVGNGGFSLRSKRFLEATSKYVVGPLIHQCLQLHSAKTAFNVLVGHNQHHNQTVEKKNFTSIPADNK